MPHFDAIVVGAGISGINTAYHLQTRCPKLSYVVLEGRHELGGTWSLFKYPGIRSDSDLHTFGFSWEPWNSPNPIAEGESITSYLQDTVKKHHIDEKIQYERFVNKLNWSTADQQWQLDVAHAGKTDRYTCKYVVLGTGYYDYKEPLKATIPGLENFQGQVIHPQFWPEDLDYTNKKIIIIGSGATAVTLLPNLAAKAQKVTQVQRSPGYFMILPQKDPIDAAFTTYLPKWLAPRAVRFKYLVLGVVIWNVCRYFPNWASNTLRKAVKAQLPEGVELDPHFKPAYNPWDQRMCITPDADYFRAYKSGKADIKTDHIQTVVQDGLILKSGEKIEADIIITATGLKIAVGGGAKTYIDNQEVDVASKFMWKNAMLSDVPNLWYVIGYVNASWTLAADATARLITRMINQIEAKGLHSATPTLTASQRRKMDEDDVSLLALNSTYVSSASDRKALPRAGKEGNWKRRSNYFVDMFRSMFGDITSDCVYR